MQQQEKASESKKACSVTEVPEIPKKRTYMTLLTIASLFVGNSVVFIEFNSTFVKLLKFSKKILAFLKFREN